MLKQDAGGVSKLQKVGLCAVLTCMYAIRSLSTTYSKDDTDKDGIGDKFPYNPNSAVMSTEILKLGIATFLFNFRKQEAVAQGTPLPKTTFDFATIARFSIPAILYMGSNNLSYLALRYLDTPTYQVMCNTGIPIVAVVQRTALKSTKTLTQWLGVAALTLGMMVIGADKLKSTDGDQAGYDRLFKGGMFLLLLECISACSGVYTEFLLKNLDLSIDFQNMLLYSWGVLFTVSGNLMAPSGGEFGGGTFFGGFDMRTVFVILVNALLGQVVSRVMKHLDNVAKFFCSSCGVILVITASMMFFNFSVSMLFVVGTGVVVVAGALYIVPMELLNKQM